MNFELEKSIFLTVPCPRELIVEKKLSRSALVSWSSPEESFVAVSQYHVCVDGTVRAIVPGSYKVSFWDENGFLKIWKIWILSKVMGVFRNFDLKLSKHFI